MHVILLFYLNNWSSRVKLLRGCSTKFFYSDFLKIRSLKLKNLNELNILTFIVKKLLLQYFGFILFGKKCQ